MIPNHQAPALSELDLLIASYVPPGGNWRDVPEFVPSQRLAQIRRSAAAGEGSRSTYYARLRPDRPAYTINTYYNRPGNGCFLHYDRAQARTLSHREAARLQSFPDSFVFSGPQRAVSQQIGNAVPPFLGFQIAEVLGRPGDMIDVFAGAGGLSLGFKWHGWRSLAATDIDSHFVDTFNRNVAQVAFVGDMQDNNVLDRLVHAASAPGERIRPLALVGGPPCQGFSTGGKRRTEDDERNGLHVRYEALLARLRPDVFIFENVLGLLSMSKGAFLSRILAGFRTVGYDVEIWRLNAAEYGVPQRRQRVIIVGVPTGRPVPRCPEAWTIPVPDEVSLVTPTVTVVDAIDDLPPIAAGQDGSRLRYRTGPTSSYQALLRGEMGLADYMSVSRASVSLAAA
jgi:DNA (cytosine-5)-methyltransferase 1